MQVLVNGVRLFFEVEGVKLVPDGPHMRERPTVVLCHGGPGADHSHYRPHLSALSEVAQLVYFDHRGNGRSDAGPQNLWTLAQWGDDVRGLCEALGVQRPIVLGASFGGMVALSYATRHPQHVGKLILMNTAARGGAYTQRRVDLFEQLGGPVAGALARRRLLEGDTSPAVLQAWLRDCYPHYNRTPIDADGLRRAVLNDEATRWFSHVDGEAHRFDLRPDLHRIKCPVLLMGGTLDPMVPVENQRDIAALLPPHLLRYVEFDGAGHGLVADAPGRTLDVLREFIAQEITE
jgi:pimeloyl-ACP methyl ester carboxylesterase